MVLLVSMKDGGASRATAVVSVRRPMPLHGLRFIGSGPFGHRADQEAKRLASGRAKLERDALLDRHAPPRTDCDDALVLPFPTPHLPLSFDEVPKFLDATVLHRLRDGPRRQR